MKTKFITGFVITIILMGCSTGYQMYSDENVDINELKGYAWKPIAGMKWLDKSAFRSAVSDNLSSKGIKKVYYTEADFVIDTVFRSKAFRLNKPLRNRPREGYIIINFVTPETGKLIWHGWTKVKYDSRFPLQKQDIDIDQVVSKILSKYPSSPSV